MTTQASDSWPLKNFRKSSYSDGSGNGQCVAVATTRGWVAVADTKAQAGKSIVKLVVASADFSALIGRVR